MGFRSRYGRVVAHDTSTAAALTVDLDLGPQGRSVVEVIVTSDGAATFSVRESDDGVTYTETESIVLAGAGTDKIGGLNAMRYIRVVCADANDNAITIAAQGQ